ncbi:MAG: methyltransferase [Thermodesulfobacteriota bacterium]
MNGKIEMTMSPENTLRQLISSQVISRLIYVVAKLGIADLLKDGPRHYERLAELSQADSHSLYRVLRTLAGAGVFSETEPGIFEQTPVSQFLQADVPGSQHAVATLVWEPWWRRGWDELLYSVKTGKVAFNHVHGMDLFEVLSRDSEAAALFNKAMHSFSEQEIDSILSAYDFSSFKKIVDIGGGHGGFISAVLKAYPQIKGILFDLSHAVTTVGKPIEGNTIADRCELVAGDFFKSIPIGGDLYTLKSVIHDWNDERALEILKNCYKAMADSGRLILIERVIPSGNTPSPGKIMDIVMMVNLGGLERTVAEYQGLIEKAGFELIGIIPTTSAMSIIECAPIKNHNEDDTT